METCPGEGVTKEEKFPNSRKPSYQWVCGEFWNLTGQRNWEGKKEEEKKKKNPQNTCLTTTPGEEVAQTLKRLPPASEQGLDREAWVDYLNRCRESL